MRRVKFIKSIQGYKAGDTAYVTPNEAHGFIDAGYAVISKDMVESDSRSKVPQIAPRQAKKGKGKQ